MAYTEYAGDHRWGTFPRISQLLGTSSSIQVMRVPKLPPNQPSRYGREKRKCLSQIALAGIGGKGFFGPSS